MFTWKRIKAAQLRRRLTNTFDDENISFSDLFTTSDYTTMDRNMHLVRDGLGTVGCKNDSPPRGATHRHYHRVRCHTQRYFGPLSQHLCRAARGLRLRNQHAVSRALFSSRTL